MEIIEFTVDKVVPGMMRIPIWEGWDLARFPGLSDLNNTGTL